MSQKTIKLNPEFLSGGTTKKETKKREKRQKKTKAESLVRPNKLRKQLLDKIKFHQKRSEEINNNAPINDTEEFSNDFNKSVAYLEQISKKKEKQKINKKTKKTRFSTNNIPISMELPSNMNNNLPITTPIATATVSPMSISIKHKNPPPYGCLKNGTKPCYREWKNTESPPPPPPPPLIIEDKPIIKNTERSLKLQEIKDSYQKENPRTEKHIKTTTYKLGKTNKKVGVLIKDRGTRRKVQTEQTILRNENMLKVKNYLRKKNLLKTGSNAPNDVIRQTYEQAILSGDITNKSGEALLHNFLS
tara:strand:+ start:911 stop:1822 length:912 start_codon:yes stop_codon:yes gene_type:complete